MVRVPLLLLAPPRKGGEAAEDVDDSAPLDPELLCRRYAPFVAAVALRLLGRDEEIEDAVQDALAAAIRDLGQLREPGAVKAWLAKVTVRVCFRRIRARRLRSFLGLDRPPLYEHIAAPGLSPDDRDLLARVYVLLDEQPAAERIAWTLRHVQGESLEEVAALCRCSLATAKRRIQAVNKALQRRLGDAGPR